MFFLIKIWKQIQRMKETLLLVLEERLFRTVSRNVSSGVKWWNIFSHFGRDVYVDYVDCTTTEREKRDSRADIWQGDLVASLSRRRE